MDFTLETSRLYLKPIWNSSSDTLELETWLNWGTFLKSNNQMIGHFQVRFSPPKTAGLLAFSIINSYQRQGFASEALKSVSDFSFKKLRLKNLDALIDPTNEASINLVTKLGFQQITSFEDTKQILFRHFS